MPVKADLTYHANPDRPFLRADSQYAFSGRAGILFAKEFARLFSFFFASRQEGCVFARRDLFKAVDDIFIMGGIWSPRFSPCSATLNNRA